MVYLSDDDLFTGRVAVFIPSRPSVHYVGFYSLLHRPSRAPEENVIPLFDSFNPFTQKGTRYRLGPLDSIHYTVVRSRAESSGFSFSTASQLAYTPEGHSEMLAHTLRKLALSAPLPDPSFHRFEVGLMSVLSRKHPGGGGIAYANPLSSSPYVSESTARRAYLADHIKTVLHNFNASLQTDRDKEVLCASISDVYLLWKSCAGSKQSFIRTLNQSFPYPVVDVDYASLLKVVFISSSAHSHQK